jgi:hypothetical protein
MIKSLAKLGLLVSALLVAACSKPEPEAVSEPQPTAEPPPAAEPSPETVTEEIGSIPIII